MTILILGAKGMLGRALQKEFESEEVVAWDKEELDITNREEVLKHLSACEPDVVINSAAFTDVEKAEREKELADNVNGRAVGYLAEACANISIPLLHVSTDYVFGDNIEQGYLEDDMPEKPLNAYGESKLFGENLLREKTDKFWLVRTAWLFGPYGNNFVTKMLELSVGKKELKVVDDQHGCPTYTRDLARAIFQLIHEKSEYGVYHFTNLGTTTWAGFAREIFKLAGSNVNIAPVSSAEFGAKAVRPKWSVLKNTKRPLLRDWKIALKDYINIINVKNP